MTTNKTKRGRKKLPKYIPNTVDAFEAVKTVFESFGYSVLEKPEPQDGDFDMCVVGNKSCLNIEIKKARKIQAGAWQAAPISIRQKRCDAVAVVFDNGYVFLESMDEYLQHCANGGTRSFTWLKLSK